MFGILQERLAIISRIVSGLQVIKTAMKNQWQLQGQSSLFFGWYDYVLVDRFERVFVRVQYELDIIDSLGGANGRGL